MRRLLVCLPLCLLVAPPSASRPRLEEAPKPPPPPPVVKDDGKELPAGERLLRLLKSKKGEDHIAFLEACMRRYDREFEGYRTTLHKHERVGGTTAKLGTLQAPEVIDCWFREVPFSVLMVWSKGAGLASRTLYVKGENKDMVVARARLTFFGRPIITERAPDSWEVKRATRYPPSEFGLKVGTLRVLGAWRAAQKRGDLEVRYLGERPVDELDGRTCWVVRRVGYKVPEDDGVTESTFYFDPKTWLMLGTELKGLGGEKLASYWFRNVQLNPVIPAETFTRAALEK